MTFKDRSRAYRNDLSFSQRVPDGDGISRNICDHCGLINYENPKIVAGVVAVWQDSILMCRRAIEPRIGFWTLPAGFMENNETIAQGAAREAREEPPVGQSVHRRWAHCLPPGLATSHSRTVWSCEAERR